MHSNIKKDILYWFECSLQFQLLDFQTNVVYSSDTFDILGGNV